MSLMRGGGADATFACPRGPGVPMKPEFWMVLLVLVLIAMASG
jgi:hypothetical protein